MTRRVAIVLPAVGLALALGAGWWLGRASVEPTPLADAEVESNSRASPGAVLDSIKADPVAAAAPTSAEPATTRTELAARPVREQILELHGLASRGDADASCRLGAAIQRCVRHARSHRPATADEAADFVARHPEIEPEPLVELMARSGARWEAEAQRCAGVTEADQLLGMRYLLAAAQRGNATARLAFVTADLSLSDALRDPELARLYAEHAPRLFGRMMSEGDPRAIEVLHLAAHANTVESRRAAWHAIPEALRTAPVARALWQLRHKRGVAFAQPERQRLVSADPTPIDPDVLAAAERLWQERFDGSVETAKLRERSARKWEGSTTPRPPHAPPDPCASDLD